MLRARQPNPMADPVLAGLEFLPRRSSGLADAARIRINHIREFEEDLSDVE